MATSGAPDPPGVIEAPEPAAPLGAGPTTPDAAASADHAGGEPGGRAARDLVQQLTLRVLNLVLGIVVVVHVPRALGPAGFGEWSTIMTVVSLVITSTELGMTPLTVRRAAVAPERERELLGALVLARSLLAVPTALVAAGIVVGLATGPAMVLAGALAACTALLAAPMSLRATHELRLRNRVPELLAIGQSVVWTAVVLVLYWTDTTTIVWLALGLLASQTLAALAQGVLSVRLARPRLAAGRRIMGELLRTGSVLGVASLIMLAYQKIDLLLAFELLNARVAGLYSAAIQTFERLQVLPIAVTTTATPLLAAAWSRSTEQLAARYGAVLRTMVALTLPAAVVIGVLAHPTVDLLYGMEYDPAAGLVPIAAATFAVSCVEYTATTIVLVLERARALLNVALVVFVLNVGANLALVPSLGILASAWIALATQCVVVVACLWVARDHLRPLGALRLGRLARTVLACVVLGVVLEAAELAAVPLVPVLALAAVTYPLALWAMRAVTLEELRQLRGARGA